jgi:VanZ family protein
MKALIKNYWPTILWAIFIFIMCTIKLGNYEGSPLFFPGFDKLVHCGFYYALVIFYCTDAIRQHSPRTLSYKTVLIVTVIAIAFGGLIELLQEYVFTWRDGDWADLFADSVGACMGAFSIILTVFSIGNEKK